MACTLCEIHQSLGFVQSVLVNCLFMFQADGEIFSPTLYVDDILICASNTELLEGLKKKFTNNFEMKDISKVSQYLRMQITREDGIIKVNQKQYMKDILKKLDVL